MGRDFFRSPPGRYLGYAHVVGAALPSDIVSPMARIWMSRATVGYIAFDIVYKAMDNRRPNLVVKGVDAAIWQVLASALLPTFLAQGSNFVSGLIVNTMKIQSPASRFVPLGMLMISLVAMGHPIDRAVDKVLDNTTRPLLF